MKNNKTKYAILGVLSLLGSMSGYDIKKFCDKSISHFWNENFGHIYPVLKQMEDSELILCEAKDDSRRKNYNVTDKGREELKKWLAEPVEYQPERSELLLKLSFGSQMNKTDTIEMLNVAKARNLSKFNQLSDIHKYYLQNKDAKKKPQYPYWLVALRYGINSLEASLKWFDETIEFLNNYDEGEEA